MRFKGLFTALLFSRNLSRNTSWQDGGQLDEQVSTLTAWANSLNSVKQEATYYRSSLSSARILFVSRGRPFCHCSRISFVPRGRSSCRPHDTIRYHTIIGRPSCPCSGICVHACFGGGRAKNPLSWGQYALASVTRTAGRNGIEFSNLRAFVGSLDHNISNISNYSI